MKIHFAVIHATYREQHTMPACVASLYAAGVEHVHLFPDSGVYGAMRNLDRALRYLVEQAGGDDHVCVVDDDLAVTPDALIHLKAFIEQDHDGPNDNVRTLYTVEHNVRHVHNKEATPFGWTAVKAEFGLWGGMVVMPWAIANAVLKHPYWIRYKNNHRVGKHCDSALYATLGHMGVGVWHPIPSLATDISGGSTTLGTTNKDALHGYRFGEWQYDAEGNLIKQP